MLLARAAWFSAMIPLIVVALVTCTDGSSQAPPVADSGASPSVLGASECPDVAPKSGDGCVLPEGTTCSFNTCGDSIARCSKGVWTLGAVTTVIGCPDDFPVQGTACTCLQGLTCNYGSTDCSAPDASTNRTVASCRDDARWTIQTFPCSDASAVGPQDAGADVQGDAGPDSD